MGRYLELVRRLKEARPEPGGEQGRAAESPVCPNCGADLSPEDLGRYGDCPRCRKPLPGWENTPDPAGVAVLPAEPDPEVLTRALGELRAEFREVPNVTDRELAETILEAGVKADRSGSWPYPFDAFDSAELEVLQAWALKTLERSGPADHHGGKPARPAVPAEPVHQHAGQPTAPEPVSPAGPPGFAEKPVRCPACGGGRFYQPWVGPYAGRWFCLGCSPDIRPETVPVPPPNRSGPTPTGSLAWPRKPGTQSLKPVPTVPAPSGKFRAAPPPGRSRPSA